MTRSRIDEAVVNILIAFKAYSIVSGTYLLRCICVLVGNDVCSCIVSGKRGIAVIYTVFNGYLLFICLMRVGLFRMSFSITLTSDYIRGYSLHRNRQ